MERELNNIVSAAGSYNNVATSITSEPISVTMIDGLTIEKTADKKIWVDGELTYTIVLSNNTNKTYVSPTITDILDDTLVEFVDGSVTIDSILASHDKYTYNNETHTLTIILSDINSSDIKTVCFKVIKKE